MTVAVTVAVALLVWSTYANLVLGECGYLARNLLVTVGLVVLAATTGPGPDAAGLGRDALGAGLRWGGGAALVVAAVLVAGVAVAPRAGPVGALLSDDRAALAPRGVAYHTLLRIPFGTALFEEVAFRGLLLAVLDDAATTSAAVAWASVVFGLWHVPPTLVTLRLNRRSVRTPGAMVVVAGAVLTTTLAGILFAGLRLASGSLAAPVMAHWSTNAGGLLAASWHRRRRTG